MNDQLQEKLTELILKGEELAPALVDKALKAAWFDSLATLIIVSIILLISLKWTIKGLKDKESWYDWEESQLFTYLASFTVSLVFSIGLAVETFYLVKLIYHPEVYLIQYILK